MLPVDVSKNFNAAASSKDGEFDTSTTTAALSRASAKPSPVSVLTPVAGDAGTTWWPCSRRLRTSFEPMSPLPPITTIFMISLLFYLGSWKVAVPGLGRGQLPVLRLHAASAGYVTKAPYSCLRRVYVLHGTKFSTSPRKCRTSENTSSSTLGAYPGRLLLARSGSPPRRPVAATS